jgi:hypothetical protein
MLIYPCALPEHQAMEAYWGIGGTALHSQPQY